MALIGQRTEILLNVFRIPNKYAITQKNFSEDIGHSTVLEMRNNGMGRMLTNQMGNGASKPIHQFPQSAEAQVRSTEGILNWWYALYTQQISSVSAEQCRDGALTCLKRCIVMQLQREWTDSFPKKMINSRNSWMRKKLAPWNETCQRQGVAGNCWHVHLQRFEMMNPDEQLRTVCEEAGFIRSVSEGVYYRTGDDVNDGARKFHLIMQSKHATWDSSKFRDQILVTKVYRDRTFSWC